MKRFILKIAQFMYFFTAGMMLFTGYAHAYIDPSAATYIIQAVAGVIIAAGAIITVFRHKIVAFFKKGKGETEKKEIHIIDDEEATEATEDTEDTKEE